MNEDVHKLILYLKFLPKFYVCVYTYLLFLYPSLLYRWIEACIEDELPPTTELEQALRNGVILCRLGHYYAPKVIPLKKIYDFDESKYKVIIV